MPESGPPAPEVVGSYRIIRRLGGGAMGQVFEGEDRRDGSRVAIKLMWPHLADDSGFRERFETEAHVAALLRSPYTVRLLDFGVSGGWTYLVMDLVEGESLADRLRRGPLPPLEALKLTTNIARALEEAEARHVVHRDLKPENILVDPQGRARVADFGIARAAGGSGTTAGGFIGTALYAAPEQARGEVDHRSDLYALGVILYQMLTGSPPYQGTMMQLMDAHARAPIPDAGTRGAPAELAGIARQLMAKEPANRFQAASDLLGALATAESRLRQSGYRTAQASGAGNLDEDTSQAAAGAASLEGAILGPRGGSPGAPRVAVSPFPSSEEAPAVQAPVAVQPVAAPRPPSPLASGDPAAGSHSAPMPVPAPGPAVQRQEPGGSAPYLVNGAWRSRLPDGRELSWNAQAGQWTSGPPQATAVLRSLLAPGITALLALALFVVASIAVVVAYQRQIDATAVAAASNRRADFARAQERDESVTTTLGLQMFAGVGVVAALAWLGWWATANARKAVARRSGLPGHVAVWGWFVPLANVVIPFLALRDAFDTDRGDRPPRFAFSLAAWMGASIIGMVLWFALLATDEDMDETGELVSTSSLRLLQWSEVAITALSAVAAWAIIDLVRRHGRGGGA